jgi:hypothetical protein
MNSRLVVKPDDIFIIASQIFEMNAGQAWYQTGSLAIHFIKYNNATSVFSFSILFQLKSIIQNTSSSLITFQSVPKISLFFHKSMNELPLAN